jgi:hypothetical protein
VLTIFCYEACSAFMTREEHDFVIGHMRELTELSQQLLRRLYQRRGAGGAVYAPTSTYK